MRKSLLVLFSYNNRYDKVATLRKNIGMKNKNHWHLFQSSFHIHSFLFFFYKTILSKKQVDHRLQKIKNAIIYLTSSLFYPSSGSQLMFYFKCHHQ